MARVIAEKVLQTKSGILDAATQVLREQGYSGLSTRNVASAANVPLSQIQYHFGSKEGMVLAMYEYMNSQLLERQKTMFADPNLSFSEKWTLACDFFDSDIESGYVRVLQELMAAGWSNPEDHVDHSFLTATLSMYIVLLFTNTVKAGKSFFLDINKLGLSDF